MMSTETIINCLRQYAKGAEWSWRRVMLAAADRLEQLSGKKDCPKCDKPKDPPVVSDQTKKALEKMVAQVHGGADHGR